MVEKDRHGIKVIIKSEEKYMKFFFSCEVEAEISDDFRRIQKLVNEEIKVLENKDYGNALKEIGIIPMCVIRTKEYEDAGFFQERVLYLKKEKDADIRLHINIVEFQKANDNEKKILLVKNVIDSIRRLSLKVRKGFDFERLETDVVDLFRLSDQ